jgi:hypothetical protein
VLHYDGLPLEPRALKDLNSSKIKGISESIKNQKVRKTSKGLVCRLHDPTTTKMKNPSTIGPTG